MKEKESKYYRNLRKICCKNMNKEVKDYINSLSIEDLEQFYFDNIEYQEGSV